MCGNMEKTMVITYIFAKVFFFHFSSLNLRYFQCKCQGKKHFGFILDMEKVRVQGSMTCSSSRV